MMAASLLTRLSDNHPLQQEDDYLWDTDKNAALVGELMMVLSSRPRLPGINTLPLVSASILNYGFDDRFSQDEREQSRHKVIEAHLRHALRHFEPRLCDIQLSAHQQHADSFHFTLTARYAAAPFTLELVWDRCHERFYVYG